MLLCCSKRIQLFFFLVVVVIIITEAYTSATKAISYNTMSSTNKIVKKTIKEICRKPPSHWVGNGFNVFPVFANKAFSKELSPFLMFDYAAPKEFKPIRNQKRGVGQHPHRGFETVTLAFQGEVEHADSQGNRDVIGPGDVQWMTAAKGIVHEEFHSTNFSKKGGIFEMCQLWVNLPSNKKMSPPRYQPITKNMIPKVRLQTLSSSSFDDTNKKEEEKKEECSSIIIDNDDKGETEEGYARIIAGTYRNVKGPAQTFTDINVWDVLFRNSNHEYEFDIDHETCLIFVRNGSVNVQGQTLNTADVAIMNPEGTKLILQSKTKNTTVLILSGVPINESIAARGPFVMNTQQELYEANRDYQLGQNGF